MGIVSALYLMSRLAAITWEVMIGWLMFGLIIYFSYSVKHSKVQKLAKAATADWREVETGASAGGRCT